MMVVVFEDRPDFTPDFTPYEIFRAGIFQDHCTDGICGYWRPIYSNVAKRIIKDDYKQYDWGDLHLDKLVNEHPNINKNRFRVKAGTSLKYWEDSGWIKAPDYRGWVEFYCNYFAGRRIPGYDDEQIKRWKGVKKRFCGMKNMSPIVKQTLLNWGIDWRKC